MANGELGSGIVELRATDQWRVTVRRMATAACAFAGGFVLAGCSEQWSLIQLLIFLAAAVWFRHEVLWCALMGTVAGFGVVMIAPGNAVRAAELKAMGLNGLPIVEGMYQSVNQAVLMVGQTLVYRFYAIVPVFIIGYIAGHGQRVKRRSLAILAVFVAAFALIAVSVAAPLMVIGVLSYRSYSAATFILITACALIGYLAACRD